MAKLVGRGLRPYVSCSAWLLLVLAACNSSGTQDSQPSAEPGREPVSVERRREILDSRVPPKAIPAAPSEQKSADGADVPAVLMTLFKEDLAQRVFVKPEAISVVGATQVDWPDGSLGCGRPGQFYTQAVVRGYRVMLSANGVEYAYHSDLRGSFVVCQQGMASPPVKEQVQQPLDR